MTNVRPSPKRGRHYFGGPWTDEKIEIVKRYGDSYLKVLSKTAYETVYIDAFAGTGARDTDHTQTRSLFSEEHVELPGSVAAVLNLRNTFHRYVFIDDKRSHCDQLRALLGQFPERANRVHIEHGDGNDYVRSLVEREDWSRTRALLLLDPYGLQVDWATIEAVARTKAIDMWLLFPHAMGVNRMLTKHGNMDAAWNRRLTRVFGTDEWRTRFYSRSTGLLNVDPIVQKSTSIKGIAEFYEERLRNLFTSGTVGGGIPFHDGSGHPLFMFYFAMNNPSERAKNAARRIADHLLNGKHRGPRLRY